MSLGPSSVFNLILLVVHSFDLMVSSVGILSIRGTRDPGHSFFYQRSYDNYRQKAYSATIILVVLASGVSAQVHIVASCIRNKASSPWLNLALSALVDESGNPNGGLFRTALAIITGNAQHNMVCCHHGEWQRAGFGVDQEPEILQPAGVFSWSNLCEKIVH
jgi:hypothetical protein